MTETFINGDWVQYYTHNHEWKPAKYVGQRGNGYHTLETVSGKALHIGPGRVRKTPSSHTLKGFIIVFRTDLGGFTLVGPIESDLAVKREIQARERIYPQGPDAVIDITDLNITFDIGQGVPIGLMRPPQTYGVKKQ